MSAGDGEGVHQRKSLSRLFNSCVNSGVCCCGYCRQRRRPSYMPLPGSVSVHVSSSDGDVSESLELGQRSSEYKHRGIFPDCLRTCEVGRELAFVSSRQCYVEMSILFANDTVLHCQQSA